MRQNFGRGKAFARSLTLVFLLSSLGAEGLHHEETQNPHGNRRERIEEARLRLSESLHDKSQRRNFNTGGGRPEPDSIQRSEYALRRRRKTGDSPIA